MTFPPDPLTDPLNDWLDARATGQVPPAAPHTDADFDALLATARQLDHLARKNEGVARSHRFHRSWEDTMAASISASPSPTKHVYRRASERSSLPITLPTHDRRWKVVLGAAAAIVLMASAWFTGALNSFLPGGGSGEPVQLAYLSFVAQGEEQRFEIAEIPDASECTVEPMTVDEVMASLQGFFSPQAPILGTPEASPTPSSVKWTDPEGGSLEPATPEVIAQANEVFRQWVACHRAGDLFRAWALESDQYLRQTILRVYGPLVSFETIRADLETVATDSSADTPFGNLQLADDTLVPMLVTSGWDSLVVNAPYGPLRIPVYWQSLDGEIAGVPGYLTQEQWEDPAYDAFSGKFLWNNAEFVLDAETGRLVIRDINANNAG